MCKAGTSMLIQFPLYIYSHFVIYIQSDDDYSSDEDDDSDDDDDDDDGSGSGDEDDEEEGLDWDELEKRAREGEPGINSWLFC